MHRLGMFVLIRLVSMELRTPRLVGPYAPCVGNLEVYHRGQWNSVCSSRWDSAAGQVVCKQIGCDSYHTTSANSIPQETGPVLLDKIQCKGTESSLSECTLSPSGQQTCETGMSVVIFCKVEQNVILEDGGSPCAGRVQARNFGTWIIICGRTWDMNDARVVCKYLGCGDAVSASGNSQFGSGIWLMLNYEVGCNGSEEDPWKCELKQLAHSNCSRETEGAGVICSDHKQPRLVGGTDRCSGRLEIQKGETWGTVCDSHWDSLDASVVCASLKCGEVISVFSGAQFGEGSGPIWQDVYECQGNETILWSCPTTQTNRKNCTHRHDVSIICSGQRRPRLVGGSDTCSGRVEIMFEDTWNTVCDTYWDLQDAAVVCNQLGCGAVISSPGGAYFGEGNGPIWNYIHVCIGNELHLTDCSIASWGNHQCTHRNDASVICSDEDWQLRLANGESICEGRVEVYYDGVWRRVIDTEWNLNEAEVVCRQLKCGSAINIYNHSKFGKGTGPTWITNVRCNGTEPFLRNCSFRKTEQSPFVDDVGVVCSDHFQIRLVDGGSRCAGRVELYYNGSWGTVCDDSWDLADAQVVCNQLKCGQALNATVSSWFGPGVGPIWLDNVNCNMKDSVLWECLVGQWSESDCNHKEDAGVICSDHRAVRLQDGANPCQGRVEVYYNRTWGTVCADSFGKAAADVVCQQLSCGSAQSVESANTFGSGSGQIWLDDVNCRLHDTLLWQCPSSPWGQHNCDHKEDVGVICSELGPRKTRNEGDTKNRKTEPVSENFELRLAAGFNNCSGRVEILFNGTWGTICDDSWDKQDAAVVCRQLNCGHPMLALEEVLLEGGNGTIWIDEVKCKGSELFLWDCQLSIMGDRDCEHKEDVKLICSGHQKSTASFNQQRPPIFFIPCIFVILLIAVSLALAAELQRSYQKDNRRTQYSPGSFSGPVYEEIEIHNVGASPDLHSNSSLNKLEYYTDSELHQDDDIRMQNSFTSFDAEFGREYEDVQ
ncbi:scavenger receptor cysteine-rich type 1 protein M130-like isoform X1 [Rhincodon typus]|uniref:scavenger receptor cysteine-rich type 1 protein M130-like isoform X1 n=1 Tax=Rhincodon typus TaxID=259920 RepID=UPI002030FC37|nr:scavenger receptor cysteine-rich type 1 protein M130-like isoform X1 [Rhincodon typus]